MDGLKERILDKVISVSEEAQDRRMNARVQPFAGRAKLATMIPSGAIGVELGVALGIFSEAVLHHSEIERLYSIDAWADHHDADEYLLCVRRLRKYGLRSVVMRMTFDTAIKHFMDKSLDFIYIDAYAHTGQQNGKLLEAWWPKLRPGGLYSGHDYDEAWPLTVEAVNAFCKSRSLVPEVIQPDKSHPRNEKYASWYVWKQ